MARHIFISYSKKDKDFAWKLADDLVDMGHKIWIDRSLQVGEDWEGTIEKNLEEAQEIIVVLSSNAVKSKWVQHEGSIAYGFKKPMYPVLIEDISAEDLPLWAEKFQYHNFMGVDYDEAFSALNAVLTPPNPIQDLLEQQVQAYLQTGELLGESLLGYIEENIDKISLDETANLLIEKSQQRRDQALRVKQRNQRLLQWGIVALSFLTIAAVILSVFSFNQTNSLRVSEATSEARAIEAEEARNLEEEQRILAEQAREKEEEQRILAEQAQIEAEEQSRLAFARQLANQAASFRTIDFQLALLLAIEAINVTYEPDKIVTLEAETVLRGLLSESYEPVLLETNNKTVSKIAISPNEKYLCVLLENQTIRVWDLATTKLIKEIQVLSGSINSILFDKDSNYLFYYESNGNITIHDLDNNIDINQIQNAGGENLLAVDEHTSSIAVYGINAGITLWDWRTNELIVSKQTNSIPLKFLFGPDGSRAIIFFSDGTVEFWSPKTETESWVLESPGSEVANVITDPAFKTALVIKNDGTAVEWDIEGHSILRTMSQSNVLQAVYSQAGLRVINIQENGITRLWDVENNKILATLKGRELAGMQPYMMKTNGNGNFLLLAREAGQADIWRTDTGAQLFSLSDYEGKILSTEISNSGRFIITVHEDGKIRQWDVIAEPDRLSLNGLSTGAWRTAFDESGKYIAAAGQEGIAIVWDVASGEIVSEMVGHEIGDSGAAGINNFSFDPQGEKLATAGWDKTARIWNVLTGNQLFTLQHRDVVLDAVFDPSGTYMATSDNSGVYLWDSHNGSLITKWDTQGSVVNRLAFSSNGIYLATAGTENISWVWDVQSKQEVTQLNLNNAAISLEFSPNDSLLAVVGFDGSASIWETQNWELLTDLPDLTDTMWDFSFSPDGTKIVTGGDDGKVRIWDTGNGELLMDFQGHSSRIWSIAYSPRGDMFATSGEDDTVRVWNAKTGAGVAILPDVVGFKSLFNLNFGDNNLNETFTLESVTVNFSTDETGVVVISANEELELPWVMSINFDPSGRYLASASLDGAVNLYVVGVNALLDIAQLRLQRDFSCLERVQFLYEDLDCKTTVSTTPTPNP